MEGDNPFLVYVCVVCVWGGVWKEVHSSQMELGPSRKEEETEEWDLGRPWACFEMFPAEQPPGLHLCVSSTPCCESSAASFQPLPSPSNKSFERTTSGRKSSCPEQWKGPNVNICRPQSFTTALSHFSSQKTGPRHKSSQSYQWGWTQVSFRLFSFGHFQVLSIGRRFSGCLCWWQKGNRTQLGPRFQISPMKHDFYLNS